VREQGCAALLEGHEVAGFLVGHAVGPAAVQDADPLEGQGTQGGLVSCTASPVGIIEDFGPKGARDGLGGPLDEGLEDEFAAKVASVHPGLVAAALLRSRSCSARA
jgi:hypothetical protein